MFETNVFWFCKQIASNFCVGIFENIRISVAFKLSFKILPKPEGRGLCTNFIIFGETDEKTLIFAIENRFYKKKVLCLVYPKFFRT